MSSVRTFALPQLCSDVLYRHRLCNLLDSNRDRRLILVQGQSAQGKSTLIASYLSRFCSLCTASQLQNDTASREALKTETNRARPVWLHLTPRESEHTTLFDLLINALLQIDKEHLSDGCQYDNSNYNRHLNGDLQSITKKIITLPSTLGIGEDISREVDILLSILASIPNPVTLVLDNLESLDNKASAYLLIQSIIDHICSERFQYCSSEIRLFLISREFPPLNISKIRINHGCLIIKNEELAFTIEETEQFLKSYYSQDISLDAVKKIHSITEGWPGGVALISESIFRLTDGINSFFGDTDTSSSNGNIIASIPKHLTAETLEYFSNEVYSLLPEEIKHFLMKASLFDEIDEEMALQLCDTENGHEILSYLEKRNLFIQRLIDRELNVSGCFSNQNSSRRGTIACYRFNALFKQFLFKALLREVSEDELKYLNSRAARFFEARGEIELSVQYYLEAQDYKMASDMIKKCATDQVVKGRLPNLGVWIEALPQFLVKNDPWLIYYLTITRRIRGGKRNVEDFLTALELFEAKNDIRGSMLATAHLIEAAVFVRKSPAKIEEWIKKGEKALLHLKDTPYFNWARAILWQQIAFGYIAGEVDIHKGISSCKNARILAKRVSNRAIELNSSIVMAFGYVRAGNFSGARTLLQEIQPLTHEDIHPEYRTLNHIVRIDFALKQGAFHEAERYLKESEKDVEKFGLIFLYPEFIELKAMHRIYTGRFKEAFVIADHLSDFSILSGNTFYLALAHHIKAIIYYHSGSLKRDIQFFNNTLKQLKSDIEYFHEAQVESEKSLSLINEQKGEDARLFTAQTLNGLILMQQKKYQKSKDYLVEALRYFKKVASGISWCETKAALGLVLWREGNYREASEYILTALNKAFQEGYERFSLISPSDFSEIVLIGIAFDDSNTLFNALSPLIANQSSFVDSSHKIKPVADDIQFSNNNPVTQIVNLLKHPFIVDEINVRNRLRELYKLTLPKVFITTLGKFSICINNQIVADNIWEGNKPKLLLKSIICHNIKELSKEMIIDDIWPDASMKAGDKSFKVNLHRLRKVLEPDVNRDIGYSYITMNAGRISLDSELVCVDIDIFNKLAKEGYENLARDEVALALSFFEQAVAMYKGDFLPEESYQTWIDLKRESLRTRYIEILMTMARVYEEQEQPFQAVEYLKKAIQSDHLNEEAYQNLMIVYADAGMLKASISLYERWRRVAISELGVEPDPETCNIYNKIQAIYLKQNQIIQFKKR